MLYMPVFAGEDRNIFNKDWFDGRPWTAWEGNSAIRVYEGDFGAFMDGTTNRGIIAELPKDGVPPHTVA